MNDDFTRDQAKRCVEIARGSWQHGDFDRAIKFFRKSLSNPYPGQDAHKIKAWILQCEEKKAYQVETTANNNGDVDDVDVDVDHHHGDQSPSASVSSSSSSSSSSASSSSSSQGAWSAGDEAIIKQIIEHNNHYSILGVARDADDNAIRANYKKLAIRCHPDKNRAPGAEEAFKKVVTAFECLSDSQQRWIYDNSPQGQSGEGGEGGGVEFTVDDLHDHFFTEEGTSRAPTVVACPHDVKGFGAYAHLLPVVCLLLLSYFSLPQRLFSFEESVEFSALRKTLFPHTSVSSLSSSASSSSQSTSSSTSTSTSTSPSLPSTITFFVNPSTESFYIRDPRGVLAVENQVRLHYPPHLDRLCETERAVYEEYERSIPRVVGPLLEGEQQKQNEDPNKPSLASCALAQLLTKPPLQSTPQYVPPVTLSVH